MERIITSELKKNWKSGLTVSLISLPLSISLAVASGVNPVAGIITAIWAGFVGAVFGGSNYNIIGPTGALSGLIASYALTYGPNMVPLLALITGIGIVLAYLCHLERYLIFIPSSVMHGFTLGVAGIIALNQLNSALGLQHLAPHEKFIDNVLESLKHLYQTRLPVVGIFMFFFLALFVLNKLVPRIPAPLIISPFGIIIGYMSTKSLLPFQLPTLGNKFGNIEPLIVQWPGFIFEKTVIVPAVAVAFVAVIETMLSAKIADTATKTRHNSQKEVLGLGLANIVSGLVGGIPATAALARTSLNIKEGATSKVSAMLNSLFLALTSFIFFAYFAYMPMAVIAAILVYVAVRMVERAHFRRLYYHDKGNFLVALFVAVVTLLVDPIMGILAGTGMALLLLVNKLAQSFYELIVHESREMEHEDMLDAQKRNVLIYAFKGKLVYLNSTAHMMRFQSDFGQYAGIILKLKDVYFIDLDGVDALEEIVELIQNHRQKVMIVAPLSHVRSMLHSSKVLKELEEKGLIFNTLQEALHCWDTK